MRRDITFSLWYHLVHRLNSYKSVALRPYEGPYYRGFMVNRLGKTESIYFARRVRRGHRNTVRIAGWK